MGLGSSPTFCRALLTMSNVSDSGAAATQVPRRLLAPGNGLDSLKHHPCQHTELQRFKNGAPRPWPCIGLVAQAPALFAVSQLGLYCTHLRHCARQPARAAQVNVMHRADGSAPRGWHQLAFYATQAGGTVVYGPSEPDRPAAAAA